MAVLATNEGELKVDLRPTANTDPTMYLPCKECNDFPERLSRSHSETKKTGLKQLKYEGQLMLATSQAQNSCSPQLREHVISEMASDEITAVARSDDTILIYGSALLEKRGRDKTNEVSQNMPVLARVVIEARKLCGDNNAILSSLIAPKNFDMLLKCAKI